ncbi:glycosyltransferase family 2 protein [uncultured Treponema sp.]|uniref:glycosyltransferase family 2 protein n=1 Tax=uncultured Treponema sp. TaxID=162155 RepID=UPI00280BB1E3|nr:glycosyltransferase family 2 protein [uncultured Treponema sp.]
MQNEPLVSVIIPTYNRGRLILDSVNSVLNQTYKNIELIVVDDCSTDDTISVLEQISDKRLKIIRHSENKGQNAARNTGIKASTGEYIAHHDSDDIWHLNKLEIQMSKIREFSADVLCCQTAVNDEDTHKYLYNHPNEKLVKEGFVSYKQLLKYNCTTSQTIIGKAECFKDVLFDEKQPRFTDWALSLDLIKKYKLYYQQAVLVDVYQQKDSITKNPQKGVKGMEMLFEKHKDAILSDPEIVESFFRKKASFVCKTGKNPKEEMKMILKYNPTAGNFIKYSLSVLGLYKYLFNIKQKF